MRVIQFYWNNYWNCRSMKFPIHKKINASLLFDFVFFIFSAKDIDWSIQSANIRPSDSYYRTTWSIKIISRSICGQKYSKTNWKPFFFWWIWYYLILIDFALFVKFSCSCKIGFFYAITNSRFRLEFRHFGIRWKKSEKGITKTAWFFFIIEPL